MAGVVILSLLGCLSGVPAGVEHSFDRASDNDADNDAIAFAVLGDVGTGKAEQFAVAEALAAVCDARAVDPDAPDCELVLLVGDNIYDSGVSGVDDPRFSELFELPYQDIDLPFFVVAGNHDWGWGGYGSSALWERQKLADQINYTEHSEKWIFPGRFWRASDSGGLVSFLGLDSTSLIWRADAAQHDWAEETVAAEESAWRFTFLHHTILSNGRHGNAGAYPTSEGADGAALKQLFDETLCGQMDAVFTGHDHDLQWHESDCGAHVLVSGAGGKGRELRDEADRQNPSPRFQYGGEDPALTGFLMVELSGDTFTGTFYGSDGAVLYEDSFTRAR